MIDLTIAARYRERSHNMGEDWQQHGSGLFLPPFYTEPWANRPTAVSLFTGAGGFDLGFVQAGFHVLAAAEWDAWAIMTYLANLCGPTTQVHCITGADRDRLQKAAGAKLRMIDDLTATLPDVAGSAYISQHQDTTPPTPHVFFGDVRKLDGATILATIGKRSGDLACVFGGPPCQGFSYAGKRQVMDPRNSLVFDFARLVVDLQPQTFCLENVPGMASMVTPEGMPVIDALCLLLERGQYGTYEALKQVLEKQAGLMVKKQTQGLKIGQQGGGAERMDDTEHMDDAERMEQTTLF